MHLRQLTVRGFKSFASATTFTFEPGVTAVVGPNGSGKSNVVDALAWVMGEQGAKNLRGGKMDDVIFAGTVSRPPLGRAQVTLTIDNSDGSLPIEYSEVTISRTLFRSGGSEYSINGRPCRLLDIQELLSDSGLGREMHVIVGQGQLDRVLHATAEDRRGLIEEAAGVLKHRRRREKAHRKLQSTDANLARLSDLTGEVARALKPLERQARVARRARDIQFELKDAQSRLAGDALASARRQEAQTRARLRELEALQAQTQSRAAEAESALPAVREALAAAQQDADSAQHSHAEARRAAERLGVVLELAQSRASSLHGQEPTRDASAELERLRAQGEEAHQDEREAAAALESARRDVESLGERAEHAASEHRDAETVLAQRQREQAQAREELLRVKGAVDAVNGRVAAARSELERAQALAGDAAAAETQAHRALADLQRAEAETGTGGDSPSSEEADTAAAVSAAVTRRAAAERSLVTARQQARDARALAASERSREQTLAATLESMATARPSSDPAAALFSDGLQVPPAHATPIGALLHDDAVLPALTPAETEAPAVWAHPVSGAPVRRDSVLPDSALWARDCASHDRFQDTLGQMLEGAVVVPDQRRALEILRQEPQVRIAVTQDGLVVSRTGQRRPLEGRINAVDLSAQLRQVRKAAVRAEEAAESADAETESLEQEVAEAREAEQSARASHSAAQQRRAVRDAAIAAAQNAVEQARSRAEQLHTAAEQSAGRLVRLVESQTEAVRRVELLESARAGDGDETTLDDLRAARDRAAREADAARALHTEASIALRGAHERHRALRSRRVDLESRLARGEKEAAAEAASERRRRVLLARAERVAELATLARDLALELRRERQAALDHAQGRLARARRHCDELSRTAAELSGTLARIRADMATLEAHLVHEVQRRADLEQQSLEQLGLSPDELLRRFGPDVPLDDGTAFVRADQERRLRGAQADMQALGKVNPLALEEFAALEQRHAFLSAQLADLRGSRGDLLKIIKDVDETIERVFAAAFEDTAREFVGVFSRLFPGGEGSLELTEPDDLLSSGLEVNARPAGKKVKRLSLLSGGERSLTAIALLVAIFKARPSPFYVMDEVEAALDDANLGRLIGLFEELRESSQLIIVTHQKRTMEVADALYGVSMRGDGVSLVITEKARRESGAQRDVGTWKSE